MAEWDIKTIIPKSTLKRNNGEFLPNDDYIRSLIVGPSKCGKATLMLDNFLLSPGWLDKKNRHIYIYSKSLNQPEYVFLYNVFKKVEAKIKEKICTFCDNNDDVVGLDECKSNSIVIFDDFIQEN
jgi:predicted AAA+ superfamily ATPase